MQARERLPTHPMNLTLRLALPAAALFGALGAAASGPKTDKPVVMESVVVQEPKTHTLFMGADIAVALGDALYPVKDVFGSSWVITFKGQQTVVPTKEGPVSLKVTPSLKLSATSATVSNLRHERGFSFNNDPLTRLTRSMNQTAATNAGYQFSLRQTQATMDHTNSLVAYATAYNAFHPNAHIGDKGQGSAAGLAQLVQTTNQALVAQSVAAGGGDLTIGGKQVEPVGYDAMEVTFEVSSDTPLANPYLVVVTRFHEKNAAPGTARNWIYAKALDPIDAHPREVHVTQEGLPLDFEVEDFQMHLYNRGVEVATTVAPRRVELTRDEAFEYVKMEYVSAHPKEDLPAVPVMGTLPAELPTRLAAGRYGEVFFTKVSKDGLADEPFSDFKCTRRIDDPFLVSVLRGLRFKPALSQGRPVEGVSVLDLNRLTF